MNIRDANALDLGFWWAQRADSTELTIIKVTIDDTYDEDDEDFRRTLGRHYG
jgi:hypothetical protein